MFEICWKNNIPFPFLLRLLIAQVSYSGTKFQSLIILKSYIGTSNELIHIINIDAKEIGLGKKTQRVQDFNESETKLHKSLAVEPFLLIWKETAVAGTKSGEYDGLIRSTTHEMLPLHCDCERIHR